MAGVGRFFLVTLLLIASAGGSFLGGYLLMSREAQRDRDQFARQQAEAQDRIVALEQQILALEENREHPNMVAVDLTDVIEPIREAVSRVALAKARTISQEISIELARVMLEEEAAGPRPTESRSASPVRAEPAAESPLPVEPAGSEVSPGNNLGDAAAESAAALDTATDTAFISQIDPAGAVMDTEKTGDSMPPPTADDDRQGPESEAGPVGRLFPPAAPPVEPAGDDTVDGATTQSPARTDQLIPQATIQKPAERLFDTAGLLKTDQPTSSIVAPDQ